MGLPHPRPPIPKVPKATSFIIFPSQLSKPTFQPEISLTPFLSVFFLTGGVGHRVREPTRLHRSPPHGHLLHRLPVGKGQGWYPLSPLARELVRSFVRSFSKCTEHRLCASDCSRRWKEEERKWESVAEVTVASTCPVRCRSCFHRLHPAGQN